MSDVNDLLRDATSALRSENDELRNALDASRIDYLRALARQARKRMDKKVERFAAKPGQAPGDANAARAKLVRARDYAAETEEVLRAMRSNAR